MWSNLLPKVCIAKTRAQCHVKGMNEWFANETMTSMCSYTMTHDTHVSSTRCVLILWPSHARLVCSMCSNFLYHVPSHCIGIDNRFRFDLTGLPWSKPNRFLGTVLMALEKSYGWRPYFFLLPSKSKNLPFKLWIDTNEERFCILFLYLQTKLGIPETLESVFLSFLGNFPAKAVLLHHFGLSVLL